jgi:hypothetical protein
MKDRRMVMPKLAMGVRHVLRGSAQYIFCEQAAITSIRSRLKLVIHPAQRCIRFFDAKRDVLQPCFENLQGQLRLILNCSTAYPHPWPQALLVFSISLEYFACTGRLPNTQALFVASLTLMLSSETAYSNYSGWHIKLSLWPSA